MTGDRSLRVLNLVANRWWTGSADPALRLTLGLRARGHHALLGLAPGDKFEAKAREAGVEQRLIAAGAPARAVHRVGGVVDTARFAADSRGAAKIREEFHVASAPLIGCVARFAAGRGHEALLEGFRLLRRERPDARLLLVGKGERRQALEGTVKGLGLEESALFAGYRDSDLPAVLHALDIFVLLRAGSDESCPAALEAMAAGPPLGGGPVGALPEVVRPCQSCLLLQRVFAPHPGNHPG